MDIQLIAIMILTVAIPIVALLIAKDKLIAAITFIAGICLIINLLHNRKAQEVDTNNKLSELHEKWAHTQVEER